VWTSGAHTSHIGEVLCRSDPSAPKHKGITAFVLDMEAPGVVIRPLRQMTGGAHFNEVFLDEVRVPDDHRLGAVDDGWRVAVTTLMNERASLGAGTDDGSLLLGRLRQLALHLGCRQDPTIRQELADLYVRVAVARFTNDRALSRIRSGQPPGPELSVAKLARTVNLMKFSEVAGRLLGPRLVADTSEWGTYAWANFTLGAPASRIAGGTDEVQRNVLAERVLGLPKDVIANS